MCFSFWTDERIQLLLAAIRKKKKDKRKKTKGFVYECADVNSYIYPCADHLFAKQTQKYTGIAMQ